MLYPPEITDNYSELELLSDEDDDRKATMNLMRKRQQQVKNRRKAIATNCTGFSDDFVFEEKSLIDNDYGKNDGIDHLDGLKRYLGKNNDFRQISLDQKIKEERKRIGGIDSNIDTRKTLNLEEFNTDITDLDMKAEQLKKHEELPLEQSIERKDHVRVKPVKGKSSKKIEHFFDSNSKQLSEAANGTHQITFNDLSLSRTLLKALSEAGFVYPTSIQTACIPVALSGRDLCACSSTGTGKTAAFMLPILERLLFRPRGQKSVTRVLILVPTRELAIQVFQVSRQLSKYSNIEICLSAGGLDLKAQEAALRLGLDIVIATPGRLIAHLHNSPNFSLSDIEVLVLDEADKMLDQQFTEQMKEIIRLCSRNRQTMLFSATMTDQVESLANLSLNKPVKLFINEAIDISLNLHQEFIRIRPDMENEREAYVASLITRSFADHSIVFVRTKKDCDRLYVLLGLFGVKVGKLHGGLTQVQRIECLNAFKKQRDVKVLCATDLAARGLDIEGVTTVVNMHMPVTITHYIHRVGRTARAGRVGRSISLIGEQDRKLLKEIVKVKRCDQSFPLIQRTIEPDIVELYIRHINKLEPSIEKLIEEEKTEKELMIAEKALKHAEKQANMTSLHGKTINKPKKLRSSTINLKNERRIRSKGKRRENKKQKKQYNEEKQHALARGLSNYEIKNDKKCTFTTEIADIRQRMVKRLRHGPNDIEFKKAKKENKCPSQIR